MPTCHICGHHHVCVQNEHKEVQEKLPPPPYNSHVDAVYAELQANKNPGVRVVDLYSRKTNTPFQERYVGATSEEAAARASKMLVGGEPVTVLHVFEPVTFRAKKPEGA
jgi:hypothetical protein